jgi:hypothetical protein
LGDLSIATAYSLEVFNMTILSLLATYAPAGGKLLGTKALEKLLAGRAEDARQILVDKLAKGKANLKELPETDAAAIIFRYMRAAEEGAARLNLKLLADVVANQDVKPAFYANEFLRWADVLSALSAKEVVVLGVMHRAALEKDYQIRHDGEFWTGCVTTLKSERKMSWSQADSLAAALMRTGLVTLLGGLMDMGHAYMPTDNLHQLGEMADLESYYMEEPFVG